MKLKSPRVWIALSSAALVLTVAIADFGRRSPGPLASVHQQDPELVGMGNCSKCHGGWFGNMRDSCLKCHEFIEAQMQAGTGLHGALGDDKAGNCALCHSEHHGAEFAIVNRQSFRRAGIEDPDEFDHRLVGFEMAGKHLELSCTKCHANADAGVLPKGEMRFVGLEQDCAKCHEDPHEGRMVVQCSQCHGQESFTTLHSLDHEKHLHLSGGHAGVSCRTCHEKGGLHSLEALGHGVADAARSCASCHENPHKTPFADSCVACHVAEHEDWAAASVTPAQHAESGFSIAKPHDRVSCDACHATAGYPGRKPEDCQSCHTDPHAGQFKEQACLSCHTHTHFVPHTFTAKRHDRIAFRLDGSHETVDCYACHKRPEDSKAAARVFAGTGGQCADCHADAHRGFFDQESLPVNRSSKRRRHARVDEDTCANCHDVTKFRDAKEFDHALWTGFAIEGAHAQAACESCHKRRKQPDRFGRTFGNIRALGHTTSCVSCHKDPHRGSFDQRGHPKTVKGRADCARCHVQTSFRALRADFDHGVWTGFPLDGSHAEAKCSACHTPLRRPDKHGRTWKRAQGKRCADCHDDPHAGQFLHTNCESCHESAKSFRLLDFDHDKDSRFPLDEQHEAVACASCHKPFRGVVRYRPLGRQCVDCHESQRDPLRRRGR